MEIRKITGRGWHAKSYHEITDSEDDSVDVFVTVGLATWSITFISMVRFKSVALMHDGLSAVLPRLSWDLITHTLDQMVANKEMLSFRNAITGNGFANRWAFVTMTRPQILSRMPDFYKSVGHNPDIDVSNHVLCHSRRGDNSILSIGSLFNDSWSCDD